MILIYKLIFKVTNIYAEAEEFLGGPPLSNRFDSEHKEFHIAATTSQRPQIPIRKEFPESWIFDNLKRYTISSSSWLDFSSCIQLIPCQSFISF